VTRARRLLAALALAAVTVVTVAGCQAITPDRPPPTTFGPCPHAHMTVKLIKGEWRCFP
jgi:hypothetical protein